MDAKIISIHAPARGATQSTTMIPQSKRFQSTLPHGERRIGPLSASWSKQFQSTLPHGERRFFLSSFYPSNQNFNPRSRTGSDAAADNRCARPANFNPRSRTGSDSRSGSIRRPFEYFNPRSRTGSDRCGNRAGRGQEYFNPRSRTGSDKIAGLHVRDVDDFNPRSRTGSDTQEKAMTLYVYISIHAPARGATAAVY